MLKLIGYCEMKKTDGKVLFCLDDSAGDNIVGQACRTEYVYGDVSKTIVKSMIGKELNFTYDRGYNGKAYIVSVLAK